MKVGDIIEVEGKKYKVTWAQGNNYSYEPYKEVAEVKEGKTETLRPRRKKEV